TDPERGLVAVQEGLRGRGPSGPQELDGLAERVLREPLPELLDVGDAREQRRPVDHPAGSPGDVVRHVPDYRMVLPSAHAREMSSAYASFHRSSSPSGRRRTRSGSSASTAPSSWVTRTTAPVKVRSAPRISSRDAGSRLFVGSS